MYEFEDAFYLQSEGGLLNEGLLKSPMRPYPYVPAGIRHIEADGFLHHSQSRIMHYAPPLPQKSVPSSAQTAAKLQSKGYLTQSNQDWFSLRLPI